MVSFRPSVSYKENNKPIISCIRRIRRGSLFWSLVFAGSLGLLKVCGRWIHHRVVDSTIPGTTAPAPTPPVSPEDWKAFQVDYQERFGKGSPPNGMEKWLSYAKANQCNERDFYSSIDEDLDFFRSVIQKEGRKFRQEEIVPHGLQQTDNYMAFSLREHRLTVLASFNYGGNYVQQKDIEEKLRWILEPIRNHKPPLNATYFFNLHDGATQAKETTNRPLFSVCKQAYWTDDNYLPTPDDQPTLMRDLEQEVSHSSLANAMKHTYQVIHKDYQDWASFASRDILVPYHFGFDTSIPPNPKELPFAKRKDAIVWRGSTTGSVWGESPRFRLVRDFGGSGAHPLSETRKDVAVDFAFVDVLQQEKDKTLAPGSRAGGENRMNFQQLQEHKYIMDVDGNAFTARFPGLLRSGSVIFKSTRYKEWYTERLMPYIDYIPVNYNLTDFVEKVEWAHDNQDITSKMVTHAQSIAKHHLRREDMRCYVYRLLLEYQTLFEN